MSDMTTFFFVCFR